MSFSIETSNSSSKIKKCDKIKFVGQGGLNIQVQDCEYSTIVNLVAQPPVIPSPPVIESSTVSNGILTVIGRVRPNARITVTNKQEFSRTIIADNFGNFTFTTSNVSGASYKVEADGESSYVATTDNSYKIEATYNRDNHILNVTAINGYKPDVEYTITNIYGHLPDKYDCNITSSVSVVDVTDTNLKQTIEINMSTYGLYNQYYVEQRAYVGSLHYVAIACST